MERQSPIAGSWYEGTEDGLRDQIKGLLLDKKYGPGRDPLVDTEQKIQDESIIGIISPHAGYVYSGSTAAHGFSKMYEGRSKIDTAIVLGPNHQGIGPRVSIHPSGKWKFPLGSVDVDGELVEFAENWDFGALKGNIEIETSAHIREHSIDIQIPFLQYLYGNDIRIFPICLADQSLRPVAEVLSDFLLAVFNEFPEKRIIVVASSDFSHEYDYDKLTKNDQNMIQLIKQLDVEDAERYRTENGVTMCGYGPIYTLLRLAEKVGSPSVEKLQYTNSGLVSGRTGGYTVGYCSFLIKGG
jgi:AmmeMemoRadiSam system protein B